MSSLIFYTDEQQIFVATDTLAVRPDGSPFMFCSKAIHLPHLNLIIAGTGQGGFSNEWAMFVNCRVIVNGINNLDYHAPEILRNLWDKYKVDYSLPEEATTTVYTFGFCQESGRGIGFAYRSTNDFDSESLQYGLAAKPECTLPTGELNLTELVPRMMLEQRHIQESLPENRRLYIGGRVNALHLTPNGCSAFQIYEFSDFQDQEQIVFSHHQENNC